MRHDMYHNSEQTISQTEEYAQHQPELPGMNCLFYRKTPGLQSHPWLILFLFAVNHLATVDNTGTQRPLTPIPIINPKNRYICQALLTRDIRKNPRPNKIPQTVKTILGPNLSLSPPI